MSDPERVCPKCKAKMERGFVLDQTYGGRFPAKWVEGEPERTIWLGVRLKGKRSLELATYRCTSCGYVESYAN
jgi:hypothetical protein